jgi:hypothetical protein
MRHLQHRLGDVDLVGMQVARQALEVAQHLEAGDAQAAGPDHPRRRLHAARVADQVVGLEHHLAEAGLAHRPELGLQRTRPA